MIRRMGLDEWNRILTARSRTSFENDALAAVLLYTRAALKSDLSDRLVYQFAALESLLVVGDVDPLMLQIRDRLAYLVETTVDGRLRVVKAVNEAYKLRSGFVHHGRPVEDHVVFEAFAGFCWKFFIQLPQLHYETKADFIRALEHLKFS